MCPDGNVSAQQVRPCAVVRIVAGDAFALHVRHWVHGRLLVAGVANHFFRQSQRDGSLVVCNVDHMAYGARVREIEVNGLTFGLLAMA